MRFIFASFLVTLSFVANGVTLKAPNSRNKKKAKVAVDQALPVAAKVFRQADAVTREMWWVVAADRKPSQWSPFGKLERAVQVDLGQKLTKMTGYRCDSYQIKKSGVPGTRPLKMEVSESCILKNPSLISEFVIEGDNYMTVIFYPEHLTELLGLQAAVVNKKSFCQIWFQNNGVLTKMECKHWTQDRNDKELVDLDIFNYQTEKDAVMEMKGNVLEGMNPTKKIETKVPLAGPIVVKETEIPDPVIPNPPPPVGAAKPKLPLRRPKIPGQLPAPAPLPEPDYIPMDGSPPQESDAPPVEENQPSQEVQPPPPKDPNYVR